MYDLIIIGAGPAGLTAALFAARYKLKTIIIGKDVGGLMLQAGHIVENWPSLKEDGIKLMKRIEGQVKDLKIEIVKEEVVNINNKKDFIVKTINKEYFGKNVLLAMGMARKKLNLPKEDKFLGKGLSYCTSCDGPLFKDKVVAVIGGNDSAATSALMLAEYAKKVYVIYRKEKIRADPITTERVDKNKKIEIIINANVTEIIGNNFVSGIKLDNGKELKLDGIFVEIGSTPSIALINQLGVKLNESNYIIVDNKQKTNVKNVFAAGDITNGSDLKQMITACSQGAVAAFSVFKNA